MGTVTVSYNKKEHYYLMSFEYTDEDGWCWGCNHTHFLRKEDAIACAVEYIEKQRPFKQFELIIK